MTDNKSKQTKVLSADLQPAVFRISYEGEESIRPLLRVIDEKLCETASPEHAAVGDTPLLLAIDGRCASGKTTLAKHLRELYDCNVFQMDDFFLPPERKTPQRLSVPGENVDHERFLEEVLLPLSRGESVRYQRYDCHRGLLEPPREVLPKKLSVIEGVYSLNRTLLPYYRLAVLLEVSPKLQRERILRRNTPETAARYFTQWIPLEEQYFAFLDGEKQSADNS